ncbi:MAG TPA: ABC transporter permease [Geobacterales bacterium]|nr:ABC transporter permease [Geobacterales bacterium]
MIVKLAIRNLLHDRARFLVTLIGVLFAVVLLAVQLGLFLGARKMISGMVAHTTGDIWIAAYGANSFEQAPILTGRERFLALSVPGVDSVNPLVVAFSGWRKADSGTVNVIVIGSEKGKGSLKPWNIVDGAAAPALHDGVIVDRTYAKALGVSGVGAVAEINGQRVRVEGLTDGIRSFTTSPYVFTSMNNAREILSAPADQATFYIVNLLPGADPAQVKRELAAKLPDVSVYTKAEFLKLNLDYWLFGTGAGVALLGGALLGLVIGTVIVAQTLYSSTKDHLTEFATLRALGSSSSYIHKVILVQAILSAIIGFTIGIAVSLVVAQFSEVTPMPIVLTPLLALLLLGATVAMCAISALSSIYKVTKIDPATVFAR